MSQNLFLAGLPRPLQEIFDENMEIIEVFKGTRERVKSPKEDYIDFPLTALYSIDIRMTDGFNAHIALLGFRNAVATESISSPPLPGALRILTQGYSLRLPATVFFEECSRSPELQRALQNQMFSITRLIGLATACNLHHPLQRRLARWLLGAVDASAGKLFDLTHEELAGVLGVRREAVTESLAKLSQSGAIEMSRGRVAILNCQALQQSACECHHHAHLETPAASRKSTDRRLAATG